MAVDNLRQLISQNIVTTLKGIVDPRPVLVTSEPFEPAKLAITQFPALLIASVSEDRQTITMGNTSSGRRQGTITYNIRGYVRGVELDKKRNDMIEAIEESLDSNRYRELLSSGVTDSQITGIEIVERMPPLAEFAMVYTVTYNYLRGTV
jgi:uncharacterized protein YdbL (DUF1318 family)